MTVLKDLPQNKEWKQYISKTKSKFGMLLNKGDDFEFNEQLYELLNSIDLGELSSTKECYNDYNLPEDIKILYTTEMVIYFKGKKTRLTRLEYVYQKFKTLDCVYVIEGRRLNPYKWEEKSFEKVFNVTKEQSDYLYEVLTGEEEFFVQDRYF